MVARWVAILARGLLARGLLARGLLVIALLPLSTWGAVSVELSSQDIDELDSVRLSIRASETRQTETLDLSALERDFHVMGTNTSSQYRFTNGREQSWVDYKINLQPKRTGNLTIPSIQVGQESTPTLQLRVRALSDETRDRIKGLIFFENELSSNQVYVQQQIILTRRLLYSDGVQLYEDLPGAPDIPDAVVLTLGETKAGTAQREGRTYGAVEQRYAIFPESSGSLEIPAITVTASVRLVENNRVSRKGVRVGTEKETITIMPVPDNYPAGAPWLPARDVILHQLVDPATTANVGDTLTHEFLIHIQGNVGSIAPPINVDLGDAFRSYPQSPVINDDTNGQFVTGSRLQTTSIVPVIPGELVVPQQRLYWWNTRTDTLEESTTPAITLTVSGDAIVAPEAQGEAGETDATEPGTSEGGSDLGATAAQLPWTAILVGIALIGVTGLIVWWYNKSIKPTLERRALNKPRLALDDCFATNDATVIRNKLCHWLAAFYAEPVPTALASLKKHHPDAYAAFQELDASLYGLNADGTHVNATITALRDRFEQIDQSAGASAKTSALPPLYPTGA